jgi:hypothetical protein
LKFEEVPCVLLFWTSVSPGRLIEPVVELHAASLNCIVQCGVENPGDQSFVSRCCVVSGRGTSTEKSRGRYLAKFDSFQYRVDSSLLSVF